MRTRHLFTLAALLSLLTAGLALATDFSGTYRAPQITLELKPGGDAYTGTLTIKDAPYPVTARENAGALAGTFTSQGAKFEFNAALTGETLTLKSGGKSYELKRDARPQAGPANPFDQIAPAPATQAQAAHPPATAAGQAPASPPPAIEALKDLGPVQADAKRDWLMLVYLDGDNNLEMQGAFNLKQMERGLPDSGVDVIVLYDRPIHELKDGTKVNPKLYRVRRSKSDGQLDSEVLKDFGAIDMSDAKTLAAFIEGAVKTYPARQHALFTWDHGGGWENMTHDENAPGKPKHYDFMTLPRFREGLAAGMKAAGLKKWDILAFDMCLMAQLEVAAEIHDLADVMVASETLEPGKGMPYTRVLEALGKGTLGGRRIGSDIVGEYDKFHKADEQRSTTLSALDLSAFDDVNAKLNALCDKLVPAMPKNWSAVAKSCFYAEQYNQSRDDFRNGKHALQSVDLLDCLKKCRSAMADFPAEAEFKDFVQAMDRFVIASANSQRRKMSNGVAIYAPVIKDAYNAEYEQLTFARISHWPWLVQALYAEQAKNNEPPKFGKIELVDSSNKAAASVRPCAGYGTSIEVEGKNIVWVRDMPGVRDAEFGGVRILSLSYVVDADFIGKVMRGTENFSQDVDVIMPQLKDGLNQLRQPQYGLNYLMSNGDKTLQAMFDNSDLRDPTTFDVLADIQDAKLGEKPVRALLHSNAVSLAVTSVELIQKTPEGRVIRQEFQPTPESKVTPLFWLYKDDGSRELCSKDSLTWNKGLTFTMDLLPAGDYEEILVAETMTGASTTARFKYKAETDEQLVKAKQSWKEFKPEMMVGTWEWVLPTTPPKPIGTTMTATATKQPYVYKLSLDTPGDDGKRKVTDGLLVLEIHDQPFFRIIMPQAGSHPVAMLGPMIWAPQNGESRIATRNLAIDLNIIWVKKGGGAAPAHAKPDGWVTMADANNTVSIDLPPTMKLDDQAVQRAKGIFDGYEFLALDTNLVAGVEMIRFDGLNDPEAVKTALIDGARRLGSQIQFAPGVKKKVGAIEVTSYAGRAIANGSVFNVGAHLIPTAKGIVAVNFAVSPQTAQAASDTLKQIAASVQLLGPPARAQEPLDKDKAAKPAEP